MSKALAKKEETAPAPIDQGDAILALIERAARDPQMDVDKMDRLFAMRERLMAQGAKTAYLAALAELQAELPAVERKGKGHNDKKYARFEDFIETVKPFLAKHGFSLSFRISQEAASIRIAGILGHKAGHQEDTSLMLPADNTGNKNPVQAHGSTIQYGKRYVGMSLLGVATEDEDDDGHKAGGLPQQITEQEATDLHALIKKTKEPGATANFYLKHFGVEGLEQFNTDQLAKIKKHLKEKHKVE